MVKVRELAVLPNAKLGAIDPKRAESTIALVGTAFTLKNPVKVEDVFDGRFVK